VQSESVGLGTAVRDWMPARWGEWRLADVWLDSPGPNAAQSPKPSASPSAQTRAGATGAKP
jgi:hypothetical protein